MLKKLVSTIKRIRNDHEDAKLGRKLVGMDQNGNKYYQVYDQQGNQTKRQCEHINKLSDQLIDPVWDDWMRYRQNEPYTQEQLDQIYNDKILFQKIVHEYEKRDSNMMKQYRQEQKLNHKQNNPESTQQQGYENLFKPGEWAPFFKKK